MTFELIGSLFEGLNLAHANNGSNKELRPVDIFCNEFFNSHVILLDGYIFCPGKPNYKKDLQFYSTKNLQNLRSTAQTIQPTMLKGNVKPGTWKSTTLWPRLVCQAEIYALCN